MNRICQLALIALAGALCACASVDPPPPAFQPPPAQAVRAPEVRPARAPAIAKPRAANPATPVVAQNDPLPAAVPPSGKTRVLFLGDSFSMGAFGKAFDQSLRNAGFEVYTSIAGGGTPYYWLKAYPSVSINIGYWERTPNTQRRLSSMGAVPKVETLMAKWNPDIVVVQTGTNLYSTLRSKKRSKEANVREVESLIGKMGRSVTRAGGRCYWITPPDAHPDRYPLELQQEMLAIIRRAGGAYGRVFDSYAVTEFTEDYPPSDGIHLGPSDARRWGERAARDFVAAY